MNTDKSKVMVFREEEGSVCEFIFNVSPLEHLLEFKYLRLPLGESDLGRVECCRKVVTWRRVVGVIRSLVNTRSL